MIVLQAPRAGGDPIEELLQRYQIEHRLATIRRVEAAELHPVAITVCNCSGEIAPAIEVLQRRIIAGPPAASNRRLRVTE